MGQARDRGGYSFPHTDHFVLTLSLPHTSEISQLTFHTFVHTYADGADPFVADLRDRTPLQAAVLHGSVKLVRRLERQAMFAGEVDIRVGVGEGGQVVIGVG